MALKAKTSGKIFKENRKSNRYPVEATAEIRCGTFSITEKTVGLSASGFSLSAPLPESLVGRLLEVEISYSTSSKNTLTAKGTCRLVAGSKTRLEAVKPTNAFHDLLEEIWGFA